MTSLLFPTFMTIASAAFGYALELAGVEKLLQSLLPAAWLSDPNVLLCIIAFAFFFLQTVLGSNVSSARRKYGVDYPIMYPELKDLKKSKGGSDEERLAFLRVVRGHENYLESNAQLLFTIICNWFILKNYATVFILSIVTVIGRIWYQAGYSASDKGRYPGFVLTLVAQVILHGTLAWFVAKKFL